MHSVLKSLSQGSSPSKGLPSMTNERAGLCRSLHAVLVICFVNICAGMLRRAYPRAHCLPAVLQRTDSSRLPT